MDIRGYLIILFRHNSDVTVPILLVLAAISLILGIIGIEKGSKEKLVIFTGKFDIFITIIALLAPAMLLYSLEEADKDFKVASMVIWSISGFLSIFLAYKANDSILKMFLVLPAKVLSCLALSLLLVLMIGSAGAAAEAVKEKKYKQAAIDASISAAAGAGAYAYMNTMKKMMKDKKKEA